MSVVLGLDPVLAVVVSATGLAAVVAGALAWRRSSYRRRPPYD